ncbi:MAG: Ig-like domain-containing protein [Flavobacteriales bacterium]
MLARWPWIATLLLAACAQVREPTGGEQDKAGPALTESTPVLGSTGFVGDRIVLRFSERVQLKSMRENLVVSPPPAIAPTVRLLGDHSVQIGLEAPLLPNTTYVFDYANGVVDLTESNAAADVPFVLSTGAVIDSAALQVHVSEARTGQATDVVEVLLYAEGDTCDPRNCLPAYFARTDDHGRAHVRYMRPGRYRVFALRDKNGNHRYDLPNEEIAMGDSAVFAVNNVQHLPGDTLVGSDSSLVTPPVQLRMFTALDTVQRLLDARMVDGALRVALSRPATTVELIPLSGDHGTGQWIPEWNNSADTVRFWYTGIDSLPQHTMLVRVDSVPMDTAAIVQRKASPPLRVFRVPYTGSGGWQIEATRLVGFIDTAHMTLVKDSIAIPFTFSLSPGHLRRFQVNAGLKPGEKAVFHLYPGALADHQRRTNDTLDLDLTMSNAKEVGNLNVTLPAGINGYHGAYVLELLDANGKALLTASGAALPDTVHWPALPPKAYALRLVEDENANGRWDTGSVHDDRQPERALLHPKGATVRAGWEVETVW